MLDMGDAGRVCHWYINKYNHPILKKKLLVKKNPSYVFLSSVHSNLSGKASSIYVSKCINTEPIFLKNSGKHWVKFKK